MLSRRIIRIPYQDLRQVKRVPDCRPPISTVCTNYASDIVSFLHGWNGTWWCPRHDILRVEASIFITARGLQCYLTIIENRLRDIQNIIAQGLWSYNRMIYWKGLSHDSTILYLTWHLNLHRRMMSIAQLCLRFAEGLNFCHWESQFQTV